MSDIDNNKCSYEFKITEIRTLLMTMVHVTALLALKSDHIVSKKNRSKFMVKVSKSIDRDKKTQITKIDL